MKKVTELKNKGWYSVEVYDIVYIIINFILKSKIYNIIEYKLMTFEQRIYFRKIFSKIIAKHYKKTMHKVEK